MALRDEGAHWRVDDESGPVHHVECTAANVADVTQVHQLLHGEEDTVCGNSGYNRHGQAQGVAGR